MQDIHIRTPLSPSKSVHINIFGMDNVPWKILKKCAKMLKVYGINVIFTSVPPLKKSKLCTLDLMLTIMIDPWAVYLTYKIWVSDRLLYSFTSEYCITCKIWITDRLLYSFTSEYCPTYKVWVRDRLLYSFTSEYCPTCKIWLMDRMLYSFTSEYCLTCNRWLMDRMLYSFTSIA